MININQNPRIIGNVGNIIITYRKDRSYMFGLDHDYWVKWDTFSNDETRSTRISWSDVHKHLKKLAKYIGEENIKIMIKYFEIEELKSNPEECNGAYQYVIRDKIYRPNEHLILKYIDSLPKEEKDKLFCQYKEDFGDINLLDYLILTMSTLGAILYAESQHPSGDFRQTNINKIYDLFGKSERRK